MDAGPKWRRRRDARPAEIVEAALTEFAENGFANAKLDAIARRAGISKAALYRYFDTKEDLFRAVAGAAAAPNLAAIGAATEPSNAPFAQVVPALLARIAGAVSGGRLPAVIRLVIGESRTFPDLASIWHDLVVSRAVGALEALIVLAQERGELVPCEPRLLALSLIGPLLMGILVREVFGTLAGEPIDLDALAAQHARIVLRGVLADPSDLGRLHGG